MNRPTKRYDYLDDGPAIYVESFATIRRESDLSHIPASAERLAVRMIHGAGQTDVAKDLLIHPDAVPAGRTALDGGAPILCDARMVAVGVTAGRLPAGNEVRCYLRDERVPALAAEWGTTRSAAAVSLWEPELDGAVVAIGNAPTALFRLLELIDEGASPPAAVLGGPVGFVGSAQSKKELIDRPRGMSYLVVRGRRGGSAMAAAAVNAIASDTE